jgi:hypothetical protein
MKKRSWTKEQLYQAAGEAKSIRQVLRLLRLTPAGGNYEQIKKYIKEYSLDVSHFKGKTWNRGLRGMGVPKRPLNQILIYGSDFQSYKLKLRLFAAKLKPEYCEQCGWAQRTTDGRLPLELDHINGDRMDNRLENLRILCPNCHSLTPTYRARNKRKGNMPGWRNR